MVHDAILKSAHDSPHKSRLFEVSLLVDVSVELLVLVFRMLNCLVSLQSLCKAASNIEDKSGVILKPSHEVSIQSCRANVDKLRCYQGKRQTAVIKWRSIQLQSGKDKVPRCNDNNVQESGDKQGHFFAGVRTVG